MKDRVHGVAGRLIDAIATSTQIEPITANDPAFDVATAYDVLAELHAQRRSQGWRPAGRKIGFTNRTIWKRYGVDRPMWSHVWDRTVVLADDGRATLSLDRLMEPRIEPEVVFKLMRPLPEGADAMAVLEAIEWIAPGFEIVHSVFPGWRFGAADCTAAFGLHGALAVGTPFALTGASRAQIAARLPDFTLTLGHGGQVVETGTGANVLGSPLKALLHLRDLLATQPQFPALAAGEIVTTGTLTDAWPVARGQTWTSEYGALGIGGLAVRLD